MKFRFWLNAITLFLLALLIFFGWSEIMKAWEVMWKANWWILSLMIPAQIFSYYAIGEIFFSYLRSKGDLHSMNQWQMTRLALELNFVNHILPSGGVAGFSYASWVLSRHGIKVSRSTMAQIIRYAMSFLGFIVLLIISVLFLLLKKEISTLTVCLSVAMI
ncbi:MAG: lysylphosphatidylglycerol synthase domain-containing protein, partial [Bacteroidales bacterium]|nr:lysylphosphatidylglycerol synthase domain-containing protein [Bacteroidales bacterium]